MFALVEIVDETGLTGSECWDLVAAAAVGAAPAVVAAGAADVSVSVAGELLPPR